MGLRVDDEGLLVAGSGDFPVNVDFDDQRVFSFWLERDTVDRKGERFFAWPVQLRRFLNGTVTVSLSSPVDGEKWVSVPAVLGTGEGAIAVVDGQGNPMGLDKSMRLSRLFGGRDDADMAPLLDALDEVIGALERAGARPFVAYGTLLGAVRDGNFIGHDSDADIGYVSPHDHPVDVIRESFDLQRRLQDMGYRIERYSGLGLKVIVQEADGANRGLDVFGGFQRDGMLYLMGEVGHPFRDEWLYPRGTAELAGRSVPVPAQPERLLEAMYGPHWRIPDPAFKFTTPESTQRRLNGWFRGMRVGIEARWGRYRAGNVPFAEGPSDFVRWVHAREPDAGTFVDVGCGRGLDVLWLSAQGARACGLDYFPPDLRQAMRRARNRKLDAEFRWLNLRELRSLMEAVARLSREPGPRVVLAHHLLDATDARSRENFVRLARLVSRDGGRCYVQAYTSATARSRAAAIGPRPADALEELLAQHGGKVEDVQHMSEADLGIAGDSHEKTIVRMVVSWSR